MVLGGSVWLLIYRREYLKSESHIDSLISRETSFVLNNIIFVAATFVVLLGTLFPLISKVLPGSERTLDASFYNKVVGPIFVALILLIGICVFLGWRKTSSKKLARNFLVPVTAALVLCVVLAIVGIREWYALTLFPLCAFVAATHLFAWYREAKARHSLRGGNYLRAFWGLIWSNRPRYGGMLVHLGIVIMALGVIGSSFYDVEKEATLQNGESTTIKGYTLTYDSFSTSETASKAIVTATLSVYTGQKKVAELTPAKIYSFSHQKWVSEVDVRTTPVEDLYVSLVAWDDFGDTATFQVLVNPLVLWIWISGAIILLGGLIAYWPERGKQR
jgi:cytochrome c-type biogenesis protein CcmF